MKLLQLGKLLDSDDNFQQSVIVFEDKNKLYRAQLSIDKFKWGNPNDMKLLEKADEIPDTVFPLYDPEVFGGLRRNLSDGSVYVKRPCLLHYTGESNVTAELMEGEALAYRILCQSPHPNIAKYMGCVVNGDRVIGLCLEKYERELSEADYDEILRSKLDAKMILKSLRSAVEHLHSVGLCHNDINPYNIMLDSNGNVVLIDFDCCAPESHKLRKFGTPGWADGKIEVSAKRHDEVGIEKLAEYLKKLLGNIALTEISHTT